jgi:hypothetical protein
MFWESGQDLQDRETVAGLSALLWLYTIPERDNFEKLAHAPSLYLVSFAAREIGEGETSN